MDQLTSYQLSEWEAYDRIDPIGRRRDEYNMAHLISTVVNIARTVWHGKGQALKLTTPEEFVPQWGLTDYQPQSKGRTMEEMKSIALAFATSHNKAIDKERHRLKHMRNSPPKQKGLHQ